MPTLPLPEAVLFVILMLSDLLSGSFDACFSPWNCVPLASSLSAPMWLVSATSHVILVYYLV